MMSGGGGGVKRGRGLIYILCVKGGLIRRVA